MGFPSGIGIVDTMIGFPAEDFTSYDNIRAQLKDASTGMDFPVEYMFKHVPKELYGAKDPIALTLKEMDRYGIEIAVVAVGTEVAHEALKAHPDRFAAQANVNPNKGMEGIREMVRLHEAFNLCSFAVFPAGANPQVGIGDALMYPIYAKCVELGVPIFCCAGVPGPRVPMWPQDVRLIDRVMYDFPELVFITRHGCEPQEDLAVKLMLKWPNLYYSTSAFAPKHYPKAIIDYANSRGADKIIYGGYFPMGLSLERILADMRSVPFKDEVWPKFLRDNARRVLKLDQRRPA
jgi:predicted TIM-barrel fold metal-dependent hydrolase